MLVSLKEELYLNLFTHFVRILRFMIEQEAQKQQTFLRLVNLDLIIMDLLS